MWKKQRKKTYGITITSQNVIISKGLWLLNFNLIKQLKLVLIMASLYVKKKTNFGMNALPLPFLASLYDKAKV